MLHMMLRLKMLVCKVKGQAEQGRSFPGRLDEDQICHEHEYAVSSALVWVSSLEDSGTASHKRMLAQPSSKAPEAQTPARKVSQSRLE